MEIKNDEEKLSKYFCNICYYTSYIIFVYVKYLSTCKYLAHILEINRNQKVIADILVYECAQCNKTTFLYWFYFLYSVFYWFF